MTKSSSPIKTHMRKIDGLSIRYAESEPREVSAILLSPWPESLFTFEQMWRRLAEHAHLVAIDLPGFGHSERRNDLLTPSAAMGEFIAHAIEEFELVRSHAVGPDIGTSALLCTAAKYPNLLRSIVLGNGTAAVPLQIGSVLKDAVEAPIETFRKLDPRTAVESVIAFVERYKLPDHVREDFLSSYEGDRFVESLRFVRSYPKELPLLSKLLPTIETPIQIITGAHDVGVLPVNGDYLHDRLPHSKHDKVYANHFAWADAADEYVALIIDWWNGGYQRV